MSIILSFFYKNRVFSLVFLYNCSVAILSVLYRKIACDIFRSSPLSEIRRLENLERKVVYTTRGKCSVYYASRVGVFKL